MRRLIIFALATTPFIAAIAQQTPAQAVPASEQVFKNIQAFKGVPANDLIPSMEFMAASLKYECADCHDAKDYSVDTRAKETARKMILMQRDINAKNFGGRVQVTCMTCHRGSERPVGTPIPDGVTMRHARLDSAPKPEDLFAKHVAAVGKSEGALVRTGTLTAPNDATHKVETLPLEFTQDVSGKFQILSGDRKIVSDGAQVTYGGMQMSDEPAFFFGRLGRTWRGNDAFAGLEKPTVAGKDTIGKTDVLVVRASRPSTSSTEELSFDAKSGLLARLVNMRRSSLGTVVTAIDYSNYRKVGGAQVPMKVVLSFGGGQQWIMDFKSAR